MWNWADDYGIGEWTVRELLGFAFPNDEEVKNAEFQCLCTEVATCFDTVFFVVGGRRFYSIPAWDDHQKNERRAQGKNPRPDDPNASPDPVFIGVTEMRGNTVQTDGDTASGTGEQGNRGTGEQGNREQGNRGTGNTLARVDDLFDSAYSHWPKKVERKSAFDKFAAMSRKADGPEDLAAQIIRFGDAYAATTETRFVPALGVWIAHERWTDELPTSSVVKQSITTEQNLAVVARYALRETQQGAINE